MTQAMKILTRLQTFGVKKIVMVVLVGILIIGAVSAVVVVYGISVA